MPGTIRPPSPGARLIDSRSDGNVVRSLWREPNGDQVVQFDANSPLGRQVRMSRGPGDDYDDTGTSKLGEVIAALRERGFVIPEEVKDMAGLIIAVKANPPMYDDDDDRGGYDATDTLTRMSHGAGRGRRVDESRSARRRRSDAFSRMVGDSTHLPGEMNGTGHGE